VGRGCCSRSRELLGKTEIGENEMSSVVEKDILWLEISVDDSCCVKTLDSLDL